MRAMILGLAALAAFSALPSAAQEMPGMPVALQDGTLLEISAEGHSTRVPDVALIEAGVTTQAPTAGDALAQNNARMGKVVAALKASGIADRDIQTSNISLEPQYRNRTDGAPQEIFAYLARNTVTVRFRDVPKAGTILDLMVRNGANTISGPTLVNSQPAEALNEARIDAIAKARSRAELYAKAAGLRVDRILYISDSNSPRVMMSDKRFGYSANAMEIQAGEQDISATVTVRFLLK